MATITSSGAGSGLNINSLVTQLVAAERAPYEARIVRAEARVTNEFSALAQLKGAMSSLQSALGALQEPADFQLRGTRLQSTEFFTATASAAAAPGNYSIEVRQLARVEQLGSSAVPGGATAQVGTGTLTLARGAQSFSVTLVDGADTLADLRDAINTAVDNPGVNAALVTDIVGTHLVLAGTQPGAANALRVTTSGGNGGLAQFTHDPPTTSNLTVLSAAQDAIVFVSGFEVHDADNTIDTAIEGVTLELKQAEAGTLTGLDVSLDGAGIRSQAERFVSAYNVLANQMVKLRSFNSETKAAGPLLGDSMLRGMENQLRRIVSADVAGLGESPYKSLASLGITTTVSGVLTLDAGKFDAAISRDPNAASKIFAADTGLSNTIDDFLAARSAEDSELSVRDARLTERRRDLEKQKERLEVRMQQIQSRYQRQFTALDSLLAQLQSTSSYLAQQLASAGAISSQA
jgi:flagellar hook-associated protein 2